MPEEAENIDGAIESVRILNLEYIINKSRYLDSSIENRNIYNSSCVPVILYLRALFKCRNYREHYAHAATNNARKRSQDTVRFPGLEAVQAGPHSDAFAMAAGCPSRTNLTHCRSRLARFVSLR